MGSRTPLGACLLATVACAVACGKTSGPAAEAEAWKDEACACSDDECATRMRQAAGALAERVSAELTTDELRLEYGKAIATGQGCLTKARWRN